MSYRVPFVNPCEHYRRLKPEIDSVINDCLVNGDLIMRRHLREFETNLAAFVGVKYAVGVNSGYHALHLSLLANGIGPGDEVITVGHTFVATVSAIVHTGATPILIDIDDDYNIAPSLVERYLTPRSRAIIPVHLNGRACSMDQITALADSYHLVVVEDAAQSLGATFGGRRTGGFGRTGCFSFYPFKVLGGFGDGGAVTTNDAEIAEMIRRLRYNGEDRETGEYHHHGYTALLDNVQAAVLNVKLRHLPEWIEHRRQVAAMYHASLESVGDLVLPHFSEDKRYDIYQNYVIRTKARDRLRETLRVAGVETLVHWPKPMWRHPGLKLSDPDLPQTERMCGEVLSLPRSAETTPDHVAIVVDAVRKFFA
jgi:dTDP-4-amino-4,6-dideoxygalactose transaminase